METVRVGVVEVSVNIITVDLLSSLRKSFSVVGDEIPEEDGT